MFSIPSVLPYFTVLQTVYIGTGTTMTVAKPNPNRAALYFSSGFSIYLNPVGLVGQTSFTAFIHGQSAPPLKFYFYRDGPLVTYGWNWIDNQSGNQLTVTEVLWQPTPGSIDVDGG